MTFRQYSALYRAGFVVIAVLAIASFSIVLLGYEQWGVKVVIAFVLELAFCYDCAVSNQKDIAMVTIDENGVSCTKADAQKWKYSWDEIASFRRATPYRSPGLGIILYDKEGKPEPYGAIGRDFQLCKTAKEALAKYYLRGPWDRKKVCIPHSQWEETDSAPRNE